MLPPLGLGLVPRGQRCGRKTPRPDPRLCRMRLGAREGVDQQHARLVPFRSRWCSACHASSGARSSRSIVSGSGTVRSFPPLPSWLVQTPAAPCKPCTRRCTPSETRSPQPYHRFTTRASGGGTCRSIVSRSARDQPTGMEGVRVSPTTPSTVPNALFSPWRSTNNRALKAWCWVEVWCTGSGAKTRRQDIESLLRRRVVCARRDIGVGIPQAHQLVIPRDRV